MVLEKLKEGLQGAIEKILGSTTVDEQAIKEFSRDLQRTLLQADVNVQLVLKLTSKIQERALKETPPAGLPRKDHIVKILYEELAQLLGTETSLSLPIDRTSVILLMGVQGSGKTTVTGKLARYLVKSGYKVGVVCVDTYRPGALTQIQTVCSFIKVEVFGEEGAKDPITLARRGVEHFRNQGKNVIIIDTAGRHKEEKALLDEMKAISAKVNPDKTILVIDGTIGQAAFTQSDAFHKVVPVGGIVISKLDGAAKGGGALAAVAATGARILFLGTGERVDDLEIFYPTRFVGRLLGMGDLKALLDKAKELEVEADEKKIQRIMSGKMTIDDLYYQLEQVKKMGSFKKIIDLIPGFSSGVDTKDLEGLEEKMSRWKAFIQSMTKSEKQDPDILNSSRIKRVSRGAGGNEREIKEMLAKYRQTKSLMKQSKGRQFRQLLKRLGSQ